MVCVFTYFVCFNDNRCLPTQTYFNYLVMTINPQKGFLHCHHNAYRSYSPTWEVNQHVLLFLKIIPYLPPLPSPPPHQIHPIRDTETRLQALPLSPIIWQGAPRSPVSLVLTIVSQITNVRKLTMVVVICLHISWLQYNLPTQTHLIWLGLRNRTFRYNHSSYNNTR